MGGKYRGSMGFWLSARDFDVCFICIRGGCGWVGDASGDDCYKELLEEGGYLWCGKCVGKYENGGKGSLML